MKHKQSKMTFESCISITFELIAEEFKKFMFF